MAWYDDPALYYGPCAEALAQGDIVAATTNLFDVDNGDIAPVSALTSSGERSMPVRLGSPGSLAEAANAGSPVGLGLAMVLPHACALEKEFNERAASLAATANTPIDAAHRANDNESLDRFIVLAPLCAYGELTPELHAGVQAGTRLGSFPVPADSSGGIPAAWVDLQRISTSDVSLIDVEPLRLASLSALAQAHLQAALARHRAYRELSRYYELQRTFGQRVTAVPITADETDAPLRRRRPSRS